MGGATSSACGATVAQVQSRAQACDEAALAEGLGSERSWIRQASAQGVGRCGLGRSIPTLIAMATDQREERWVRAAAAEAVGALEASEAVPTLIGLAAQPALEPEVRLAVIAALSRLSDPDNDACGSLAVLVSDDDLLVAARAGQAWLEQCER